jgi:hypothetical protein
MARAYNATVVKNNPVDIYGLKKESDDPDLRSAGSIFVSIMYEQEYKSLPVQNVHGSDNGVHWCTRADHEMQRQMIEFINSGDFTTACEEENCHREYAKC